MRYKQILTKKFLTEEYLTKKNSIVKIAKQVKCGQFTILRYLRKFDIKTRGLLISVNPPKGKNHWNWQGGKTLKKYYCKDCHKKISTQTALYGTERCHKCAHKGKNNGNYIHGRTSKKVFCKICGKQLDKHAYYHGSTKCLKCYRKQLKISKNNPMFGVHRFGKTNPNYIHGKSNEPYPLKFNDKLKEKIRKRDNYTCQKCNITEEEHLTIYGQILSVHHIDYNKKNCKELNLITLCNECNIRVNYNRKYWEKYFKLKITTTV